MENTRMMRRKTRGQRRKLMRKQKLYGLVFVLLSILICLLYLIFTKEICISG